MWVIVTYDVRTEHRKNRGTLLLIPDAQAEPGIDPFPATPAERGA